MVTYKRYPQEKYEKFLKIPISETFGFSWQQVKAIFDSNRVAHSVFYSSYPDLQPNFKEFCDKLTARGVSPIMFIQIMIGEGGGAANFINHWMMPDSSSNWRICLDDDLSYIVGGNASRTPNSGFGTTPYPSMMTGRPYQPSVSAPECGNWVSEDTPGSLSAFFNSLPDNSIGRYYMPATLAGNAWVWCTNSCNANYVTGAQANSQPYGTKGCYFGNPYDDQIAFLENNGVNIDDYTSGNNVPGKSEGSNAPPDIPQENTDPIQGSLNEIIGKPLYISQVDKQIILNNELMIKRVYGNMYQIMPVSNVATPTPPSSPPTPTENPAIPTNPNNPNDTTNETLVSKIYAWSQANLGQMYTPIFGGSQGAGQCYEYFCQIVQDLLGGDMRVFIGTGQNAIDLRPPANGGNMTATQIKQMGSLKWHEANSIAEYNGFPNGCLVVMSNPAYDLGYGHIATKSGDYLLITGQNQTPGRWGAPISTLQIGNVPGYNVFGAWF